MSRTKDASSVVNEPRGHKDGNISDSGSRSVTEVEDFNASTYTMALETILRSVSVDDNLYSLLDTNAFCALVSALHSLLTGLECAVSLGSTSTACHSSVESTNALASLGPMLDRHSYLLSEWEAAGCRPFEGLSARRKQDWANTSFPLRFFRYATYLMNEALPVAIEADSLNGTTIDSFSVIAKVLLHTSGDIKADPKSSNASENRSSSNGRPPLLALSHVQVLYLLYLAENRDRRAIAIKDNNLLHAKAMVSIDGAWIAYREPISRKANDDEASQKSAQDFQLEELSIDNNGSEWIANPLRTMADDLTALLEFQNNVYGSQVDVNSANNTDSVGILSSRPVGLTYFDFAYKHLPQVAFLSCLLSFDVSNRKKSCDTFLAALNSLHGIVKAARVKSPVYSSFTSLIDAKISIASSDIFADDELFLNVVTLLKESLQVQRGNYISSYELARLYYSRCDKYLPEAISQVDQCISELKYFEDMAAEVDGPGAPLPPFGQVVHHACGVLSTYLDTEGVAHPGQRVEVMWTVQNDDGSRHEVFYPAKVLLGKSNVTILKYDEDDGQEHKVQFLDDTSLLNLNEDCTMFWRFEGDDADDREETPDGEISADTNNPSEPQQLEIINLTGGFDSSEVSSDIEIVEMDTKRARLN